MEIRLYPEEDAAFINLQEGQFSHVESLDDARHLAYGTGGELLWISLLYVSDSVDLSVLSLEQLERPPGSWSSTASGQPPDQQD